MKMIEKQLKPPERYKQWRSVQRRSPDYSDIPQELKRLLKQSMIREQKGLCCYCCGRINFESSHIEHLYPRHLCKTLNRKKQTDYKNMCASCNGIIENLSDYEGEFCGHRKNNWYNQEYFISPLDSECENHFKYTSRGAIHAKDDNKKANEMIRNLALDAYALNEARAAALEAIGYFNDDFDVEEAKKLLVEDLDGNLPSFSNIVEYFVKKSSSAG
jgi:uncharacterized protein (TIGR02646 family)